jgi:uncharacterized protein (TIGR02588 family)
MGDRRSRRPPDAGQVPVVEWLAGLTSLGIVLGCLGTVAWQAASSPEPPRIHVSIDGIRAAGGSYYVHVTAHNSGQEAAAEVTVAGRLQTRDGEARSTVTLDYLPGRGRRGAALIFGRDPRAGVLTVAAESYRAP